MSDLFDKIGRRWSKAPSSNTQPRPPEDSLGRPSSPTRSQSSASSSGSGNNNTTTSRGIGNYLLRTTGDINTKHETIFIIPGFL